MAKKSAKSKGYRKSTGKKPYLSKRDIIMLCALLAIVAVGAILLFSYDDGALKTRDGKIVDAGENWLVVNGASSGGRRYYKLGELGELEGFKLESDPMLSDENLNTYKYTPEDGTAGLHSISVSASAAGAGRVSEYYRNQLSASLACSEPSNAVTDAGEYTFFTYTNAYYAEADEAPAEEAADADEAEEAADEAVADADGTEEAADEAAADADDAPVEEAAAADEADGGQAPEPEPNRFEQAINAYIDAGQHGCVGITAIYEFDSADDYLSDDALKAVAEQVIGAIRFEG